MSFSPVVKLLLIIVLWAAASQAQTTNPRLRGMVGSSVLTADNLSVLAGWKANLYSVQLVTFGEVDAAGRDEYFSQLSAALERTDAIVAACAGLRMKVLINLYYPPGGFSVRTPKPSHRIFTDAWAQKAIIDAWTVVANRYKGNPAVWGYQLVNEPAFSVATPGLKNWNELAQTLAQNIRAIDPSQKIIVNPPFGDPGRLKTVQVITGVSGVVYAVYMYHPFKFSHQRLIPGAPFQSYPSKKFRKTLMERYFKQIQTFQKRAKTPIHIHEISVARWAPRGSGARWLKDAFDLFEKNKWTWAYHAFREASVWNVEVANTFGSEEAATRPTDRLRVIQAFFKKNRT